MAKMPVHENLREIAWMVRHDPLAVIGLCLIGLGGVLAVHILLKLNRAKMFGVRDWRADSGMKLPSHYLRVCKQQGWSPWPAYFVWPSYILGAVLLIFGMLQWEK